MFLFTISRHKQISNNFLTKDIRKIHEQFPHSFPQIEFHPYWRGDCARLQCLIAFFADAS